MARRSALFWAVLLVVVLGAALYAPAFVARSATSPDEPVDFLARPVEGWRFMLDAVRSVPDARAGSPGEARDLAVARFGDGTVQPVRVDLLYLPDERYTLHTRQGSRDLATKARLVWKVAGRTAPGGPVETVGLIDLASGTVIYDARDTGSKLAQ